MVKKIVSIFKIVLHVVFIIAGISVLALYIISHYQLDSALVGTNLKEKLSEKLQTQVEIETVEVNWLNQIALNDLVIFDKNNDTLFYTRRAVIAVEIVPLIEKKLIINSIQIIDFRLSAKRETMESETNYAFLLEAVMPKEDDNRRKFINDISLHALMLREGTLEYDVMDQPRSSRSALIDTKHVRLTGISASITLDVSHTTGMKFNLKRATLKEQNGLVLNKLHGNGSFSDEGLKIEDMHTEITKEFFNGYRTKLATEGTLRYRDNLLEVNIPSLDLYANPCMEVHTKGKLLLPMDSLQHACFDVDFKYGKSNIQQMQQFLSDLSINVQENECLNYLQEITWSGKLQGQLTDSLTFQGHVATRGNLEGAFSTNVTLLPQQSSISALTLDGEIQSLEHNNHLYADISLDGRYRDDKIHLSCTSKDPLCHLKGSCDIVLHPGKTGIIGLFNVHHFAPNALHISEASNLEDLSFSGITKIDLTIPHRFLDNPQVLDFRNLPNGHVGIDSLTIISREERVNIGSLYLDLETEQNTPILAFLSALGNVVSTPTSIIGVIPANPTLARIFKLPGELGKEMTFQMVLDTLAHEMKFDLNVPEWLKDGNTLSLHVNGSGDANQWGQLPTTTQAKTEIQYRTEKHALKTELDLQYLSDSALLSIAPFALDIDDRPMHAVNTTEIRKKGDIYHINGIRFVEQDQEMIASGTIGPADAIDIKLQMENWQLDYFFDLLQKGYVDFGGYATGDLYITSQPDLQMKTDDLQIRDFSYIQQVLGNNSFSCNFDFNRSQLLIHSDLTSYPSHTTHIDCDVRLHDDHDSIELIFDLDSLKIDFLSYWLGGALEDLHGHGSGDVYIAGDVDSLNLLGHPLLQNVGFTNSLLGARFYVTDTLNMEIDGSGLGFIGLNNVTVRDRDGQEAILTMDLEHHHLHDLEYGLDIDIPETSHGFLVFDHPVQQPGDLYWGKLWATGRCQMNGTYNRHRISMQASTSGHSFFNLSPGEENYADNAYNFLVFRDKKKLEEEESSQAYNSQSLFNKNTESPTFVEADLLIHANERCQVYIQMDPLAEDRLVCKGSGDLALHYDPYHDINLVGNYDITSGSYTVTMRGDLMTKAFQLQSGSRVIFPGSPRDAELDLNAVYNIPSANLRDLDESFATVASLSRTTLPVDCKLNVTGQIAAPQIAFDLEVKNTSDEVQALVHNIIGTQEMLNREVFYLLLFSKFYTPEYAATSQRQTGSELTSFASSSLTSQLNNLLGHMSDNFTLGTNFRSDKGDFSDMEMDVSVSTRLLNDRLLMTGNLGYRDTENSMMMNNQNRPLIGDFDVEFLMNTRGTVRAKAYSHYNDRDYSINNALTTQGIGIILRKDFRNFRDLLKNASKR